MRLLHDFLHWCILSRAARGMRDSERDAAYSCAQVMPRPRTIAQAELRLDLRGGQRRWLTSSIHRDASRR